MKTRKILFLCIIVLILACGMLLSGCGSKCENDGGCFINTDGSNNYVHTCSNSGCSSNNAYRMNMTRYTGCNCK